MIVVWLCLIAVASALVALQIYNYMTGRNFLLDLRDKRRLEQRTLADCERQWIENPRDSGIVVCLTTLPSRVDRLGDVLKSLLVQTRRPSRIRLHLPDHCRREDCGYQVPPDVAKLQGVEIVRCTDYGPATKLIPALADLPADQLVLVVDDDMLYPAGMLEALRARADAEPDAVHAMSGWIVPDDLKDTPTTVIGQIRQYPPVPLKCSRVREVRQVDIFQGYSGFLVRPRFFDLESVTNYEGAPEQARYVDDVWLSGHCNAPKYVLPHPRFPFSYWRNDRIFSAGSLGRFNDGHGDHQHVSNTVVMRHMRDRWMNAEPDPGIATPDRA